MPKSPSTPLPPYTVGTPVSWHWGAGTAHGVVEVVHTTRTTITSKGAVVTRNATPANPAYTIVQPDKPNKILKSHSEIHETY